MTSIFSARSSLVAAILAAGAAVAFAAPASAADGQTSARNQSGERTTATQSNRRICVQQATTGTRLTRRICRTAAEWQAEEGYVPR